MQCPVCSGDMWDQTKSKWYDPAKNQPIWKCKDKSCKGVIWPPKNAPKSVRELDAEELLPISPAVQAAIVRGQAKLAAQPTVGSDVADYFFILIEVVDKWSQVSKDSDIVASATFSDIKEMATTIYIQRSKR